MLPQTRTSTISAIRQDEEQEENITTAAVDPTTKLTSLLEQLVMQVEKLEQDR